MSIWVLLMEKIATLTELETTWSLDDVLRAHAILNFKSEQIEKMHKKAKK